MISSTDYTYNIDEEEVIPKQTIYGLKVDVLDSDNGGTATILDVILGNISYDNFDYHLGVYSLVSEPVYLTSTTATLADPDNPSRKVITRTDYEVDDTYLTVKETRTTNSEGQEVIARYQRAPDLGTNLLTARHMHSQLLEQSTLVGGQIVQKATTTYTPKGDLVVPTTMTTYPNGGGNGISVNYTYDTYGNVIQTQRQNDVPTAHLWGYNHSLKVAEVVGQTYAQAAASLDVSVWQGTDGGAIRAELDKLRRPNRLVTTYTYDPLVGIISETDPAGITTYYDYDDRNRLRYVRDHRQQYVTRYQYRYQGQPE